MEQFIIVYKKNSTHNETTNSVNFKHNIKTPKIFEAEEQYNKKYFLTMISFKIYYCLLRSKYTTWHVPATPCI